MSATAHELARWLASADIYVSGMADETFGISIIEAQASGLPVVGVAAGAMIDRVTTQIGRLGPVDDADAMAANILDVWSARSRDMGERARRTRCQFSWDAQHGGAVRPGLPARVRMAARAAGAAGDRAVTGARLSARKRGGRDRRCDGRALCTLNSSSRASPACSRTIRRRSPITGTQTYLVGDREVAVIDPGPDLPEHVDALVAAIAGRPVAAILCTHTHRDHSPAARPLAEATGAPIIGCAPLALETVGPRADAAFDGDYRAGPRARRRRQHRGRRRSPDRRRDARAHVQSSVLRVSATPCSPATM